MNKIAVVGKADTRILVYCLARALSLLGRVAIVTDDQAYRRLYAGLEDRGTVSGVDIYIVNKVGPAVYEAVESEMMAYDHMIAVTNIYVPECIDQVVICRGVDHSMHVDDSGVNDPEEPLVFNPDDYIEHEVTDTTVEVVVSFEPIDKKNTYSVSLRDSAIKVIYACEERNQLVKVEDKNLCSTVAKIFAGPLGIDEKDLLMAMSRSEGVKSK